MQDAFECGFPIGDMTLAHERIGDVRSSERPAIGRLGEHVVPTEVKVGSNPLYDALGPMQPSVPDACRLGDDRGIKRVEQVGENVHTRWAVVGAELHARNDCESRIFRCLERFVPTSRRIVVSERHCAKSCGRCRSNQLGGSLCAV
jgi:hypothetical protein